MRNKVIIKEVGKELRVQEETFDDVTSYEYISEVVQGYIEVVRITPDIVIWINEEGKLQGLVPTMALFIKGRACDFIVGNYIVTGVTPEGDTVPLTDEQVETFNSMLGGKVRTGATGEYVLDCLNLQQF